MKKVFKYISITLLFISLLLFVLHIASRVFIPKWLDNEDNMYTWIKKGFYEEEENTLDLLFIGNSDVYRGISPIILWDNHGIASYAYSAPGQRVWTGYYMLKEALLYQNPEIVIFNVDAMFNSDHSAASNYRKVFDNMKPNSVKWEALRDEAYEFSLGKSLSYYFPIFRYHDRYKNLSSTDLKYAFANYHFAYKGLDMIADIVPYSNNYDYMADKEETITIPEKTKTYLDKIVKLCEENEITLILIQLPSADSWSLAKSEAIKKYADTNSLEYIDFNLNGADTGFEWLTDTSDGGDHLNLYGAEKITTYLGEYLTANYQLPDRRNDSKYDIWYEDSKKYHEDRAKKIEEYQNGNTNS